MCPQTKVGHSNLTGGCPKNTYTLAPATATVTTSKTTPQMEQWDKNLSGVPLTKAQLSLLAHGPNFSVAPRQPPSGEYIATVEQACQSLEPHDAKELRAEKGALKHSCTPRKNIAKEEAQTLAELRRDQSRVILTADKRVAQVVLDKTEYTNKAQDLLDDGGTYKEIKTDPTNKLKNKLINLLKKIKTEGGISDYLYKEVYPTGAVTPKFYGLCKIQKRAIPPRPIVTSRGSTTYEVAKELAKILRLLVGNSPHHIKSNCDLSTS